MNFSFDNFECNLSISDTSYWKSFYQQTDQLKDFSKLMRSMAMSFQQYLNLEYGRSHYILDISFERSEQIKALNKEHRNKDKDTDVLSFPLQDSLDDIVEGIPVALGDICISLDQTLTQAKELGVDIYSELIHLQVHGFLHLIGFDHEISLKDEQIMEEMEQKLILDTQNIYARI